MVTEGQTSEREVTDSSLTHSSSYSFNSDKSIKTTSEREVMDSSLTHSSSYSFNSDRSIKTTLIEVYIHR